MAETVEMIDALDLYEHYLTSPTSPVRWRDAMPTFVVNGYVHDDFCDLVERLGWQVVEDRELPEETHGGWGAVTIRREPPASSVGLRARRTSPT